ncbi:MAG: lysylphosphatidylglycerol synthase transmembrane domain-containing protein [Candidatus Omnitrophota bacterium]
MRSMRRGFGTLESYGASQRQSSVFATFAVTLLRLLRKKGSLFDFTINTNHDILSPTMKGKLSIILRVMVSAGLIFFLAWNMRGHFGQIARTLSRVNISLFILAIALFILNVYAISCRLNLVIIGEGLRIPYGRIVQLTFIGYFFNNFMPTAVGGDIVKTYYVFKQTKQASKSVIAVFIDRFIGMSSFIFIGTCALLLTWQSADILVKKIVLVFAVLGTIGILVILNGAFAKLMQGFLSKVKFRNVGDKLSKVYKAVHGYKAKKMIILKCFVLSLISQCIFFTVVFILIRSLGVDNISLGAVFMIMPLVCVASMLPSLGGLGLREGATVALFGPIIGNDVAFSASILLLASLLVLSLVGAVIYLTASQFKLKGDDLSKLGELNPPAGLPGI